MGYNYAIFGSGRQGTATAYDLALFGDSDMILLADQDLATAQSAAARVNKLVGKEICQAAALNAKDQDACLQLLKKHKISALVSGVPYFFNVELTKTAIKAGASFCDYGGNTDVANKQLALSDEATAAGVTVIPDCGMAPGLANSLNAYAYSLLDKTESLITYDCGLPQNPLPPWNYSLSFSIEGLTNEYHGKTNCLRNGKLHHTNCFEEYEVLDFPEPFGQMEAFTTAGGVSTLPWTYEGKVQTLQNKTLRYLGHYAQWKVFQQAGLFELDPIEVNGEKVIPRHVLHKLIEPQIRAKESTRDLVIIRVIAKGQKAGEDTSITLDVFDYYDEATGFSAMERCTGFHAGIMAIFAARGQTPRKAVTVEQSIDPLLFLEELKKRDIKLTQSIKTAALQNAVS